MPRCSGSKPDGTPCERIVKASQGYCFSHDPARAEERQRNAKRAGKSKPTRELADLKRRLSGLAEDVLVGKVDRANAAVAGQLLNTVIRAVGVELKVREQLELVERLEAVERLLTGSDNEGSNTGWG
jgi:hypothetical protein